MASGLLPDHIGPLVDRLRRGDHQPVSLPDVAALTEVLMRSLESYFRSIDLTLYQECQSLADYINDARAEIASLSPDHSDSAQIPRAGQELEAIVQQTENATHIIMESAEAIMSAETDDPEAFQATVHDAVMKIFEACSFQDITGQRISKVVRTLEYVENRIDRLINILGIQEEDLKKHAENTSPPEEEDENKALLHGPALEGEGIDQTEVDALMEDTSASEPPTKTAGSEDAETPEPAEQSSATTTPAADAESTQVQTSQAQTSQKTASPASNAVTEDLPENLDPDDIDALFAEPPATAPAPAAPPPKPAKKRVAPPKYEENAEVALDVKSSDKTTQADIDALFG
tara:strand:+ start:13069 stop:14106 length:1038 start_codon:yes stop_codon:yes gene_type:complete